MGRVLDGVCNNVLLLFFEFVVYSLDINVLDIDRDKNSIWIWVMLINIVKFVYDKKKFFFKIR